MRNIHGHDKYSKKNVDGKYGKRGFKGKKPLAERFKRVAKAAALALSLLVIPVSLVAVMATNTKCTYYTVEGVRDGGIKDGGVDSGDASQLDAEIKDVNVPDARPDVFVQQDSAVDAALDAEIVPDASVMEDGGGLDSGVDSGIDGNIPTCPTGVDQERLGWFRPIGVAGTIGVEYEVTYSSFIDPSNITIDVSCVSTGNPIVTDEQLTLNQESIIALGGKNLRVTVTGLNVNNALMDATIE